MIWLRVEDNAHVAQMPTEVRELHAEAPDLNGRISTEEWEQC